jgi:NAD(P)-dependent dehydrogenase (short-subunit alcohol dehydrogenase family)
LDTDRPLLLATEADETLLLAKSLDAELSPLPACEAPETFETWRSEFASQAARGAIVVAPWENGRTRGELMGLDESGWRRRFELPYLLWNFALGAAARRCADGGAIVAIVQAPAALEAPGWTPELSIADGLLSLIRSIAASEGTRGVRANLVTTPIGLTEVDLVAPPPPLAGFPGQIDKHVAGAVRMLLCPDAHGLTGRVLPADGGRSL